MKCPECQRTPREDHALWCSGRVMRDIQIGWLNTAEHTVIGLCCYPDPPRVGTHVAIYRQNIGSYKQTCSICGRTLVEPATPAWPILFDGRR